MSGRAPFWNDIGINRWDNHIDKKYVMRYQQLKTTTFDSHEYEKGKKGMKEYIDIMICAYSPEGERPLVSITCLVFYLKLLFP